ncbi:MAG: dUTP diphosphatase [Proteobacteria bacterium]|nr:dUTP diphosphatase [Pseudomonadota bacterium]MBU1594641.1 dUTP diphosphatase [Pseudomonadota bacterium]
MQQIDVHVQYLHELWAEHRLEYATLQSAGLDLRACIDIDRLEISAGGRAAIPAGIAIEIRTPGIAGFIFSRSGLGARQGLTVSQGVGVIDPDYRGQLIVSLLNTSGETRFVERGQRIAQLVLLPCFMANLIRVDALGATERGAGGFGHTGTI